jgi:hypothetical protein
MGTSVLAEVALLEVFDVERAYQRGIEGTFLSSPTANSPIWHCAGRLVRRDELAWGSRNRV